jgi:hypothetical protein
MPHSSTSTRALAQQLLSATQGEKGPRAGGAVLVSDRLRTSLIRFAGTDGFASLLRRALVLATVEVPSLRCFRVGPDGHLERSPSGTTDEPTAAQENEGAVAITAHLLELLITFIGQPITLRLVHEAWPGVPLDQWRSRNETNP